jgi:hypothetical protein
MKEEVCCPKFNPKPWDNKVFTWKNKRFIKGKVFTLFFIPLNFGGVMTSLMSKIDASKAKTNSLCLSDHSSLFNMSIYVDVDREIKGAENVKLSGTFLSKVYEGDYKDTDKWCKDYEEYAKKKDYSIKKWYMWYTTCPACAKKYGKNYTVIINEVEKL